MSGRTSGQSNGEGIVALALGRPGRFRGICPLRIGRAIPALSTLLALAGAASAQAPAPEIRWEPYELRVDGAVVEGAELGRMRVPERRSDPATRSIEIAFVRLPGRSVEAEPVVYLDGGPGGSGVGVAEIPAYYRLFDALRERSDVILLSQRGTGLSTPRLGCPLLAPLPDDLFSTRERMVDVLSPSVTACARTWQERGADLLGYTTRESADDVEALRRGLGADRISLLGFSYGTHLGLEVLRRHGDRVARAVLLGTEGPDHAFKLPSVLDRQLEHLSLLAAEDETAREATPDLRVAVEELLAELQRRPLHVEVEGPGGEPRTLRIGADGMRYLLRQDVGDTNDIPLWPAAVRMTLGGDLRLLASLAGRRFREVQGVPLMGMLMDCASSASPERLARIEREEESHLFGAMTNTWFPDVCALLPHVRLGPGFRTSFSSDVPTLFLGGTLDANTPPYQAWTVSWGWPRATRLVVEGAGHESLMPHPGAQEVIVAFLRGEDVSDREITLPPIDFFGVAEARRLLGDR